MRKTPIEIADPAQWLRQLAEDSAGYHRLVSESKGLARAAYRLARARCTIETGDAPMLRDLKAAVAELGARLGAQAALPIESLLPDEPHAALSSLAASASLPSPSRPVSRPAPRSPAVLSTPPPAPSMRRPKSRPRESGVSV
jgi:hypothetical protein